MLEYIDWNNQGEVNTVEMTSNMGEQGWRSGESSNAPRWIVQWFSPCSVDFSPRTPAFLPLEKLTNISKFQFDRGIEDPHENQLLPL